MDGTIIKWNCDLLYFTKEILATISEIQTPQRQQQQQPSLVPLSGDGYINQMTP